MNMSKKFLMIAALACVASTGALAQGGGVAAGAATGAVGGAVVGGPIGGIADQQQPQFRQYVVTQKPQSYVYADEVRVGAVLPAQGVTYYEVPAEYKVQGYRYTVVNDTPVLVEPGTRRIVQIVR
jgi:hypothetical protein